MTTAQGELGPLFRRLFPGRRFVVVSNREPYEHRWSDEVGEVDVRRPAGGLTSALDPLMQALGGTWVAWGSGEADAAVVDQESRVRVPPEDPAYTLRRVWLSHHDIHRYYLGYANQFLWPLCHLRPDLTLAHFWHIPWPPVDIFRLGPQAPVLLRGLLANDLMGFHLPAFADNFLNDRFGTAGWRPIHLVKQSLPSERLAVLYRLADVCIVSSLQDGMNLVAKEYVASQVDEKGVLVLSEFAGAAEELEQALLINPYAPEDFALKIRDALALPPEERRARIRALYGGMRTIFDWMRQVFAAWGELRVPAERV